jgi:hypothetical protein
MSRERENSFIAESSSQVRDGPAEISEDVDKRKRERKKVSSISNSLAYLDSV